MKEHIKTFIDFLKSHEAIFHFLYKAKSMEAGNIFASFSIPKIYIDEWGPTLISFWFQDNALLTVAPFETTLEEVFPILKTTEIKRCWISTQSEAFTELSFERVVEGMLAKAGSQSLFIDSKDELFAEISDMLREYVEKLGKLDQAAIVITERI